MAVTLQTLSAELQQRLAQRCQQFDTDIGSGLRPKLAEQLADWPLESRDVLLQELLSIELEQLRESGSIPQRGDYLSRFAESREVVEHVFDQLEAGRLSNTFRGQRTLGPSDGETVPETVIPEPKPAEPQTIEESEPSTSVESTPAVSQPLEPETLDEPAGLATAAAQTKKVAYETLDERDLANHGTIDEKSTAVVSRTVPQRRRGSLSEIPKTLGDYELLDELGKGGMGVVYRARQRKANRIVALKLIRPDRLSGLSEVSRGKIIARFRTEAQAAARLQHDNLVTVFEVGEIDGCHYFSMQYVEGGSLADKLRTGPLDNLQAAGFIEPICRAVHAAHQAGVLHRDIKPHNIMIENATNRPRIADFGLAKLADEEDGLTKSGETMGTPPYMPPEQFGDAANCTAAADIYSLGASLYHSLSGRPPFQAASSIATMRQVLDQDPVSLRTLNAAVDIDLDTICMKCLEKEPARRYGSAAELADELLRYQKGEPILSRPLSRSQRALRWSRRNPLVASLMGAVLGLILVTLGALGFSLVKTEGAKKVVEQSLDETKVAKAMSDASFQDALSAVNEFFTRVSEDRLLNEPGSQGLRRELLELAHGYYQKFLKQRDDDPAVLEELAATHYRIGLIVEELESPAAAMASYEKARDMLVAQIAKKPNSKPLQQFLSNTFNAMGRANSRIGKLEEAERLLKQARTIRAALVANTADPLERFEFDRLLANVDMNLALLDKKRGNFEEAGAAMSAAQEYRTRTQPVRPRDRKLRRDLAKGHFNLANLAVDLNDPDALTKHIQQAIKLFEALLLETPDDIEDRHMLAQCHALSADLEAALVPDGAEHLVAAVDHYLQARAAYLQLISRNPAVPAYRIELAQLILNLGQLEAQRDRNQDALKFFQEAATMFKALIAELPGRAELVESLKLAQAGIDEIAKRAP